MFVDCVGKEKTDQCNYGDSGNVRTCSSRQLDEHHNSRSKPRRFPKASACCGSTDYDYPRPAVLHPLDRARGEPEGDAGRELRDCQRSGVLDSGYMPTPGAESQDSRISSERQLGIGECLGVVALILLPGVGFAALVVLSLASFRPHLWGVARAALLWHVLLWSALATAAMYLAIRVGAFVWQVLSHLGPVR